MITTLVLFKKLSLALFRYKHIHFWDYCSVLFTYIVRHMFSPFSFRFFWTILCILQTHASETDLVRLNLFGNLYFHIVTPKRGDFWNTDLLVSKLCYNHWCYIKVLEMRKTLYGPWWRALEIFGLYYFFQYVHIG